LLRSFDIQKMLFTILLITFLYCTPGIRAERLSNKGGCSVDQKQRFLGTLSGKKAGRFPYFDLDPDEETVEKWRREGLPGKTSVAEFFNLKYVLTITT